MSWLFGGRPYKGAACRSEWARPPDRLRERPRNASARWGEPQGRQGHKEEEALSCRLLRMVRLLVRQVSRWFLGIRSAKLKRSKERVLSAVSRSGRTRTRLEGAAALARQGLPPRELPEYRDHPPQQRLGRFCLVPREIAPRYRDAEGRERFIRATSRREVPRLAIARIRMLAFRDVERDAARSPHELVRQRAVMPLDPRYQRTQCLDHLV